MTMMASQEEVDVSKEASLRNSLKSTCVEWRKRTVVKWRKTY